MSISKAHIIHTLAQKSTCIDSLQGPNNGKVFYEHAVQPEGSRKKEEQKLLEATKPGRIKKKTKKRDSGGIIELQDPEDVVRSISRVFSSPLILVVPRFLPPPILPSSPHAQFLTFMCSLFLIVPTSFFLLIFDFVCRERQKISLIRMKEFFLWPMTQKLMSKGL